ncbi:MAG: carbohydrate kinase family protein [Planctomycetes bacterium]|nr:carbohydrate kinase family protein [Planctomycetota bacterium]
MNFPGKFQDHILADKLHVLNVSFLVNDLKRLKGGCAANIAYACALHGLNNTLVAAVGSDFEEYGAWLASHGVGLEGVSTFGEFLTASCFITTDGDNNQITGFYPGAMARAGEVTLAQLGTKPTLATISPNDPSAMKALPQECREQGIPFLYDPGQQVIALSGDDLLQGLTGAEVVVANDYEAAVICEKTGLSEEALLEHCKALVVTLGERGSRIMLASGERYQVPPAPVAEALDPTGAGDAFRGGLVKGLVHGYGWESAARVGALTASYCVESRGTSTYHFSPDAFAERFERVFGELPAAV